MAEICCGVLSEEESTTSSQLARRRRMEIRRFKFVTGVSATTGGSSESVELKRPKMEFQSSSSSSTFSRECNSAIDRIDDSVVDNESDNNELKSDTKMTSIGLVGSDAVPRFGTASVCGRRRDMEDAIAVHPCFVRCDGEEGVTELHYFGVYDGHGCSHVATKCKERLHEVVKEELAVENSSSPLLPEWRITMEKSFSKMDKEVISPDGYEGVTGNCRCELQAPDCDAVGSTAVVAVVTPDKIVVANCGDSRAVLCRSGKAVPLSSDHKPDRPDELNRIEEAGGRVIYWDGPRVLGVLAMSRALGDNYLKPYVSCEPEVTITDRTFEDECLILASDGLWDVVSNETACGVARMCLRGKVPLSEAMPGEESTGGDGDGEVEGDGGGGSGDGEGLTHKACSDASMLLTKLALARHSADNVSVVVINLRKDT